MLVPEPIPLMLEYEDEDTVIGVPASYDSRQLGMVVRMAQEIGIRLRALVARPITIDDPGEGWTERESENAALERLAREIPEDLPRLLLAHRPSYFTHASRLGFPLVLSGHTHGGQVALPFAHHWNPSRMISHRTRGRFHHEESTLYVSRGLGMAGLPLRINCPREIALLQLVDGPPRA